MGAAAASGVLGGLQILESKNRADAIERKAKFDAQQLEFNSKLIDIQRGEIFTQAEKDVERRNSRVGQMLGSQKVSFAAQGISLDSAVVEEFELAERQVGAEDVAAIKNNAWREAFGLEVKASDLRSRAQSLEIFGEESARQTLATGTLQGVSTGVSTFRTLGGSFGGRPKPASTT